MARWLRYYFLFSTLFILYDDRIYAQKNKVDSLSALIEKDGEDTTKVDHLNNLGWALMNTSPDTAIILSNQALVLCEKVLAFVSGREKRNTLTRKANTLGQLGVYYAIKADFPKSIDWFLKALKIDEEINNKNGMANRLGNIGNVYKELNDQPKALDYYLRALKMDEELGNKYGIARHLGNIGILYYNMVNLPKALDYYFQALKMDEELGNESSVATWLGNIGIVYNDQKDFSKAQEYFFKALAMKEKQGDKNGYANILGNIGALFTDMKKYPEAEKYLMDALAIDREIGAQDDERHVEDFLCNLYTKTKRYQLALDHYKRTIVIKDSLFSKEKGKELTRKEMNYEFDKKVAGTKAEQEKKDAVTKIIIYSVSAGFFVVLLLAVFIFRGFKQKQKANHIITEQKLMVEEKQKEILDSIHYAKRIQQSLLPTEKYIAISLERLKKIL